jgi:hypothetical protein
LVATDEVDGSEVGAASAAADVVACVSAGVPRGAASAARGSDDGVAEDVVFLRLEMEVRLVLGHRGHEWESCPTCLQHGQALDAGQDAITLNPKMSKKGGAVRDAPTADSLSTISQRLVRSGNPLTVWGASSTTSPY